MRAGCSTAHPLGRPTDISYLDALMVMGIRRRSRFGFRRCAISADGSTPALTALCQVAALAAIGRQSRPMRSPCWTRRCCPYWPVRSRSTGPATSTASCWAMPSPADLPRMHVDAVDGALVRRLRRLRHLRRGVRRTPPSTAGGHRRLPPTSRGSSPPAGHWRTHQQLGRGRGLLPFGEVLRLQGDVDGAFATFARAHLGVDPQPGEALLRWGQGDGQIAWTTCGSRWRTRQLSGFDCCLEPSRSRWRNNLDEPTSIAASWKTAQGLSARRVPGLGCACARRVQRGSTVMRSRCCSRRCASTGSRSRGMGAAQVYEMDGAGASGAQRCRRGRRRCRLPRASTTNSGVEPAGIYGSASRAA